MPDLVVELLSEGNAGAYDEPKRESYRLAGVRHYWLVRLASDPWSRRCSRHGQMGTRTTSSGSRSRSSRWRPCRSRLTSEWSAAEHIMDGTATAREALAIASPKIQALLDSYWARQGGR